ncbi:hypothetical protein H6F77_08195 [Microcoleus sp. FACHB-831]|uniref:hypothetical protein n=1 Tax=Microcoleus sp. FACHB-831 TaxID=2692827 RepID=UPI001687F912|nr:hypothetical protein [Microcoleus sp. FACHB-831]MBD1921069.1 hypothetical protein [Microcoleus sp. FACHB-831]
MSHAKIITELTPEQEALIPVYREKWREMAIAYRFATALSTEPIARQKAKEALILVIFQAITKINLSLFRNKYYDIESKHRRN